MVGQPSYLHPRYARQHVLREFGLVGQEKLCNSRVLIVGAGGLGSPAAMYLAAAGIGTLGLADIDVVDESNLHRQLLYGMHDIGAGKLEAAQQRLRDINPMVTVRLHEARIDSDNANKIISQYDIVLDGTDNFPARYAINDACVELGIPFVYGSVARFEGQVSVFAAPNGPCYRCLFSEEPAVGTVPNCAEDGVLGILPGIVGLHQSTEVIKWLTGIGRLLIGRLLMLDLLDHSTNEVLLARNPACVVCGDEARNVQRKLGTERSAHEAAETSRTELPEMELGRTALPRTGFSRAGNPQEDFPRTDVPRTDVPRTDLPQSSDHSSKRAASLAAQTSQPKSPPMPDNAPEIDVTEVAERLRTGDGMVLLDVREPWEFELAQLPNAVLVPLSTLPSAVNSLDSDREYVVYCHHGMRSAMAANWLKSHGFQHVHNMTGGIDAWSVNVDRSVPQY